MGHPQVQHDFQPVSFGKYLLLQKIGSGGMAEIYRSKTFGPHGFVKECAVKKILPHLIDDADFMRMFIDEARIAVNLSHANIVQVYDLGEIDRQAYIAMEYVPGKDLLELLARCDALRIRLPVKLSIFIMMEVLKGLEYAHRARDLRGDGLRIIHRDVSPCNILLSYNGEVKLSDFGVAKAANQRSRTEHGMLKGKVGYMSPEQISGERLDKRSDIFSAGVVLFEILAMRRLFIGPNDLNVMLKIRDGDIDKDLKDLAFLPSELRAIVREALAHQRRTRYRSANDLHRALMDFLFNNDIRVTGEDLGRFMRRVFAREYALQSEIRQTDPDDSTAFPALQSPQVARYRFREPNGLIVGPTSLETLMSILRYRHHETGNAVSVDSGPWVPPADIEEVRDRLKALSQQERGIASSHHLGIYGHVRLPTTSSAARGVLSVMLPNLALSRSGEGEVESVVEGRLETYPFAMLLYDLFAQRASGLLSVSCDGVRKSIFIEGGAPGYVASNQKDELLGNFLCDHGVLSVDQLQLALNRLGEFGGRLGDVLVQEQMLPETELFHYLSLQTRQKLLEVFTWTGGLFSYQGGRLHEGESYPLGIAPLEIVVQGIRSRVPEAIARKAFDTRRDRVITLLDNTRVSIDGLNLSAKELGIAANLRDGTTAAELLAGFEGHNHVLSADVWKVLYMLLCTRLLRIEHTDEVPAPNFFG